MTEVPEGQVPRDAAFWRTFHAVELEHAKAIRKLQCERDGHAIAWGVLDDEPRCECGMTVEQVYELYEAQGRGRMQRSEDGQSFTFHWGRS